jgi:hypothetical protein
MNPMPRSLTGLCITLVVLGARAEWTPLADPSHNTVQYFIQMDSVKQTGPMSIYRQVQELAQGPGLNDARVASKVILSEYNCMTAQVRVLSVTGFAKSWAQGEQIQSADIPKEQREWRAVDSHAMGAQALAMVCPDGTEQ